MKIEMLSGAPLDEVFPMNNVAVSSYRSSRGRRQQHNAPTVAAACHPSLSNRRTRPSRAVGRECFAQAQMSPAPSPDPSPLCDLLDRGYSPSIVDAMDTREPIEEQQKMLYSVRPKRREHPYYQQPTQSPDNGVHMSYPFENAINFYDDEEISYEDETSGPGGEVVEESEDAVARGHLQRHAPSIARKFPEPERVFCKNDEDENMDILKKHYEKAMYFAGGIVLILLMERFIQMGARLA